MGQNCWEYKKCGREAGGKNAKELGVCPAFSEKGHHSKNGGRQGGRYCWKVAGTFCGGKVQGTWAMKMTSCSQCDFFKLVKNEEGKGMLF